MQYLKKKVKLNAGCKDMLLLITGGCGSGKTWIAKGFQNEMNAKESTVILDCVAEVLAVKMESMAAEAVINEVIDDIHKLKDQTENLIVVTNEVFSDVPQKGLRSKFVEYMGRINQILAGEADLFVEAVYGIPVLKKQIV